MNVHDAVASRRSVRDFLPTPVDGPTIRRVLQAASRSPSGGNLQPWHVDVLGGERLAEFRSKVRERLAALAAGASPEATDYDIYPKELVSPYRDRRFQVGEDMYACLGIAREDRPARLRWFARNFDFFGAPLALFCSVDRRMGPPQWSDLGMFLQTVMLLLRAEGLDSCPQECWAVHPHLVGEFIGIPPERMLFCGMAIGHADPEHPVNRLRSRRGELAEFARFHGI